MAIQAMASGKYIIIYFFKWSKKFLSLLLSYGTKYMKSKSNKKFIYYLDPYIESDFKVIIWTFLDNKNLLKSDSCLPKTVI